MATTVEAQAERRISLVKVNLDIFDKSGTMLYIGASPGKMQLFDLFDYDKTILEVSLANYESLTWPNKVWGDVRNVYALFDSKDFDVVVWWHGPEHVYHCELAGILHDLKWLARRTVLLGCPYGYYSQEAVDGNLHERHLSHYLPPDFKELGLKCATQGTAETGPDSCMIGWYNFG